MSPDPQVPLARIRDLCLALPSAAERMSHGTQAFFIEKGRFFAYFWHNHHGDDRTAVLLKTGDLAEQEMLIEADPDLYFRPPYLGPSGWVGLRVDGAGVDWDHVGDRIARSWELAAPGRLLEAGGR